MRHKANVLLEQIKTIKKLLVMKNVFVKGFALLAVVALSFANVSCETKTTEENVEAAADATVEAAEATVEAADATVEAAGEAVVDGANATVEAAAEATQDAAQATEAAANEVKEEVAK